MHDKDVGTFSLVSDSVPDQYKTQEMCDKVVSKEPLMLKYCLIDIRPKKYVIKLLMLVCQH